MTMTILSNSMYKDGGTLVFDVSSYPTNMKVHVDRRIGTTTKGSLWNGYPDKGRLLTEEEVEEFQRALKRYYEYTDYVYAQCIELFKEFGYKKPAERIERMDTVCECGKSGSWRMGGDLKNDLVACGHCGKIYPRYIYLRG